MMRAEIRISDTSDKEILRKSLSPETTNELPRTNVSVKNEGNDLVLILEAEDVSSLRAVLNSYLRWLKVAMETKDMIGGD